MNSLLTACLYYDTVAGLITWTWTLSDGTVRMKLVYNALLLSDEEVAE